MTSDTVDVLLVEDSPEDAELTIRELKRHRLANSLVQVKDGEEAIAFLYSRRIMKGDGISGGLPKVILLDIHMPRVDGMEVLHRLKSDEGMSHIPVVILTSSNQHPDIQKCYDLGAKSYIVKPLSFEKFSEAILGLGFYWLLLDQLPNQKQNHFL